MKNWEIIHQKKFNEPILSFDACPDSSQLAFGTSEGNFFVKARKERKGEDEEEDFPLPDFVKSGDPYYKTRIKNFKYFNRGIYNKPQEFDFKFENKKRAKIQEYDKFLKKFQYKDALASAVKTGHSDIIVSIIEELLERSTLKTAIRGLDSRELDSLTKFLGKKVTSPKFSTQILHAISVIVETHGSIKNEQFLWLKSVIDNEVVVQKEIRELSGAIDVIVKTGLGY